MLDRDGREPQTFARIEEVWVHRKLPNEFNDRDGESLKDFMTFITNVWNFIKGTNACQSRRWG